MYFSLKEKVFKNLKMKNTLFKHIQQCHSTDTKINDRGTLRQRMRSLCIARRKFPVSHFLASLKGVLNSQSSTLPELQVQILKQHDKYTLLVPKCILREQKKKYIYMHLKTLFKKLTISKVF